MTPFDSAQFVQIILEGQLVVQYPQPELLLVDEGLHVSGIRQISDFEEAYPLILVDSLRLSFEPLFERELHGDASDLEFDFNFLLAP